MKRIILFCVIGIDLVTKMWVVGAGMSYQLNTGVAFSLFGGNNLFHILSVLILVGVFGLSSGMYGTPKQLILGGAVGNLLSRVVYGGVVDFVKIGVIPAFNIADLAIVLGVAVILRDLCWNRK